ncbi:MAG: L-iditol 2-dehydrogenase [Lautropia sp.]|nr:L-iditol 2-dehydrogenase [Lautropia sp.]
MSTTPLFDKSHTLITGAGGGIGLAMAAKFLNAGARCTLVDLSKQPSDDIVQLQQRFDKNLFYQSADVTDRDGMRRTIQYASEHFGPIQTLVNNAAVFDMSPILESSEESFDRLFSINVKAMFFTMQAVLQHMLDNGVQGGSVINFASQAGRRGEALVSHYCATKAAVISYTQSAALAMAPHGIRVNAISPGVVDTPMWKGVDALFAKYEGLPIGEKKRQVGLAVPLGRMGVPDEIADVAVFLASDAARYITAQTINVDGGNVMS